jgi:NADPH-dependent 2,4-dienoyl-CoA reductase/sulfur reductase-like enzyme/peroxiredoxin family protein/rhodanese-related sulfurtransferase/TusA-related sulfurtransferase
MGKKVLIVGGVAGGASAAARLRRLDEQAEIIIFERGEHISYANCGLPYYVGRVISDRKKLLVQTPQVMRDRFNIDVRVNSEVIEIRTDRKEVVVRERSGRTYSESYDFLILSPGASPVLPPIPGIEAENVFAVRSIPDVDAIKGLIEERKITGAAVVGGGFIGLEMAENLHRLGIQTFLIEMANQVLPPLDYEMAVFLHHHLRDKGINLILNDGVGSFGQKEGLVEKVVLQSGREIPVELVIMAVGVRPEVELARRAGLAVGEQGGILVNERLQTSDPHIFAIGDAIEFKDFVTGRQTVIPLAGPANKQGRIVADIIAGREAAYGGTQGTSIVKVFDLVAAATGANEKILKNLGIPYEVSYTHPGSHAGYYPGSVTMHIKLLFDPAGGKILGAQIVGREGVDKRIDVLAAAIRRGDTVFDLQELELAYAPPFSSAKDPVNMAGYVAGNIVNGDLRVIHWHQIDGLDRASSLLIDVRTPAEFEAGHIPGAVNIPVDEIRRRLGEIPKDKEIVVYCRVGLRGYLAYRILVQNGFPKVRNLSGGWLTYHPVKEEEKWMKQDPMASGEQDAEQMRKTEVSSAPAGKTVEIDARGLQCPGPIVQVFQTMKNLKDGDMVAVSATDPGFLNDIKSWCANTGNRLLKVEEEGAVIKALIRKGRGDGTASDAVASSLVPQNRDQNTFVVFSGDLDKAIASFIIANGSASMGKKVTMFFTFWGLNILRRKPQVALNKGFMDRLLGKMMPQGSTGLPLSKMNMLGLGPRLIRRIMQQKNVASLEQLIEQARRLNVRLVACNMTMEIMGIKKEELIEGVEIGGVATFLNEADKSGTTLFI